jgi:hypothetical protein
VARSKLRTAEILASKDWAIANCDCVRSKVCPQVSLHYFVVCDSKCAPPTKRGTHGDTRRG